MEQENEHVFTAQEMLDVAENEVCIIDAATFKDCHLADTRVRQMLRQAARIIEADSKIERVIRDAVVDYNEMFPSAPNDGCERELRERAGRANAWLTAHGFAPEPFRYDAEQPYIKLPRKEEKDG